MTERYAEPALYVERVVPGIGLFVATSALLPAIALVAEPFGVVIGIVIGILAVLATWFSLIYWAPRIQVTKSKLKVGRAHIPRSLLGKIEEITKEEIFQQRGPLLDPKAFTSFQSSVRTALKIEIRDKEDQTPYWLVSTRRPAQLASVLRART